MSIFKPGQRANSVRICSNDFLLPSKQTDVSSANCNIRYSTSFILISVTPEFLRIGIVKVSAHSKKIKEKEDPPCLQSLTIGNQEENCLLTATQDFVFL